jgi:CRP-like cAMP-binding protein
MRADKTGWRRPLLQNADLPHNFLLRSLSRDDIERLSPFWQSVSFSPRRVLHHAGVPIRHLYFVEEGLVSVLARTDDCNAVELWLIGREGVVGSSAILGMRASPFTHFVQIGGRALRLGVEDLDRAMSESSNLRSALQDSVHAALIQSSQSAACGLKHSLAQRLARWLLTAQDRSQLDELPITHDLLARSLGVHRPTVTGTMKLLESRALFSRKRGLIRILDRTGLQHIACRCYRVMSASRNRWERFDAKQKLLVLMSLLGGLVEIELMAQ